MSHVAGFTRAWRFAIVCSLRLRTDFRPKAPSYGLLGDAASRRQHWRVLQRYCRCHMREIRFVRNGYKFARTVDCWRECTATHLRRWTMRSLPLHYSRFCAPLKEEIKKNCAGVWSLRGYVSVSRGNQDCAMILIGTFLLYDLSMSKECTAVAALEIDGPLTTCNQQGSPGGDSSCYRR